MYQYLLHLPLEYISLDTLNKRCQDCFFMFFSCNRKAINLLGEHGWTLNKFI